ncbi:MAG: ABC transporter ATP-binding protein [Ectothiorhodospiraceae bacterium]|nr:ABC transporter ATP-binding protein [Chromatiales bacterium]MCP5157487.1 ABC transporter ATP-binding protein [Ectothiorhodospiraceae bacterium]
MSSLTLTDLSKHFGPAAAVDRVSLEVADGEFLAVLGPSGCGKTTMLRLVAGFERASDGEVRIGGRLVSAPGLHVPPEERHVGIVFQTYALWPHMTVAGNVGYPLRVARVARSDREARVEAALATVGLAGLGGRRPAELSGGQRQRVALARCLVMEPRLVLLDEPLANLDVHLRAAMEDEFVRLHRATGATMLYITHDQAEAMALADRIAVMDGGRIVQVAAPRTLYREPATPMVAAFVGRGAVMPAEVLDAGNGRCAVVLREARTTMRCTAGQRPGQATVSLRPEWLGLDDTRGAAADGLAGRVRRVVYRGRAYDVEVTLDGGGVEQEVLLSVETPPDEGAAVRVRVLDGWVVPDLAPVSPTG